VVERQAFIALLMVTCNSNCGGNVCCAAATPVCSYDVFSSVCSAYGWTSTGKYESVVPKVCIFVANFLQASTSLLSWTITQSSTAVPPPASKTGPAVQQNPNSAERIGSFGAAGLLTIITAIVHLIL
jgi:hypothetical protein